MVHRANGIARWPRFVWPFPIQGPGHDADPEPAPDLCELAWCLLRSVPCRLRSPLAGKAGIIQARAPLSLPRRSLLDVERSAYWASGWLRMYSTALSTAGG